MNLVDFSVAMMERLGPLGVALLIFLENVFPPIPSEVVLPLAGVAAAGPENTYIMMWLGALTGSVTGAWLLYGLGRALGPERLRVLFIKLPLVNVEDFDKSVEWMGKHGFKGIFFGRMVPGIRSLISIPAGLYAMPIAKFTVLTALGSGIWNTIFITFGYVLGNNWPVIEPWTDLISKIVYVIIILLVVWFFIKLVLREKRRRESGEPDPDRAEREAMENGEHEPSDAEQQLREAWGEDDGQADEDSADRGPTHR